MYRIAGITFDIIMMNSRTVSHMQIYTSNDTGVTWHPTSALVKSWYGVTSDYTGIVLVFNK